MQSSDFPRPDAPALAHSDRLRAAVVARIRNAGGAISFADFMNCALYEPGLGYYMAGAAKFGEQGDFVTAPETSELFGQTLAIQAAEILDTAGGGVLELGAGTGRLAGSLVTALHERPGFTYLILEPSAELAQRQRQYLQTHLSKDALACVRWLSELPESFDGLILANEVMDALPVERFGVRNGQLLQHCVTEELTLVSRAAPDALTRSVVAVEADLQRALEHGYESEINLLVAPWLSSLAAMLSRGVVLLIDYGYPRAEYYSPERHQGTLACYYRHRMHDDPFLWPGLQDITAHVDFTAVVECALENNLELIGYASQSAFLLDNDLLGLASTLRAQTESEVDLILLSKEIKTLTLPGEMGERFQVMALGKGYDAQLRGFRTQDHTYRL